MKRSAIAEATAGAGAPGRGEGWEQGRRGATARSAAEAGAFSGPETPTEIAEPQLSRAANAALALPGSLVAELGVLPHWLAVHVSTALVREAKPADPQSRKTSQIATAQVLVGPDHRWPVWSRTTLLSGTGAAWPKAWLAAAKRALVEVTTPLPRIAVEPATFRGVVVVDAFATADLLRLAVAGWGRQRPAFGERVAATCVHVSSATLLQQLADPRNEAAAPAGDGTQLVEAGVWVGVRAVGPESGGVPVSWRQDDPGILASAPLCLEARTEREPTAWPEDALVITGLVPLRSSILGRGHLQQAGHPTGTWGPAILPDPGRWLARITAAVSSPVDDATGVPVRAPAVALDP